MILAIFIGIGVVGLLIAVVWRAKKYETEVSPPPQRPDLTIADGTWRQIKILEDQNALLRAENERLFALVRNKPKS